LVFAFLITIAGCGGSSGGGGSDPGTPAGNSIVTATSGTITHTATLPLIVQ
jgi:hypothetical protein